MKKLLMGICLVAMVVSLFACLPATNNKETVKGNDESEKHAETVAVVDDVTGKTYADAYDILSEAGFTDIKLKGDENWAKDRLIVSEQSKEPGTECKLNEEIVLTCLKKCFVGFNLTSEDNLMFSRYDIEVYIDDSQVGTVSNGKTLNVQMDLLEGKHELKAVNTENNSINATKRIDVDGDFSFSCDLSHGRKSIEFKKAEIVEGIPQSQEASAETEPASTSEERPDSSTHEAEAVAKEEINQETEKESASESSPVSEEETSAETEPEITTASNEEPPETLKDENTFDYSFSYSTTKDKRYWFVNNETKELAYVYAAGRERGIKAIKNDSLDYRVVRSKFVGDLREGLYVIVSEDDTPSDAYYKIETIEGVEKVVYYDSYGNTDEFHTYDINDVSDNLQYLDKAIDNSSKIESVEVSSLDRDSLSEVGNSVFFGKYEQDGFFEDGLESIEWLVIGVEDSRCLLLSRYALEALPYNETQTDVTWETCSIRKWLNSEFYNNVFTEEERSRILLSHLDNSSISRSILDGGNATDDYVFLLSYREGYSYLDHFYDDQFAYATEYILSKGVNSEPHDATRTAWIFRTPGKGSYGRVMTGPFMSRLWGPDQMGWTGVDHISTIRPAIWVDLNSFD